VGYPGGRGTPYGIYPGVYAPPTYLPWYMHPAYPPGICTPYTPWVYQHPPGTHATVAVMYEAGISAGRQGSGLNVENS